MRKVCGVVWCCTGDLEQAEEALRPARELGPPLLDGVAAECHSRTCRAPSTRSIPPGLQWYWRADFVDELPDEAVAAHAEYGAANAQHAFHDAPLSDRWGGARRRVRTTPPSPYRDSRWAEVIVGVDPDPANAAAITDWTKRYWEALHPHSAGGAYVNFLMHDEGSERVKATYGDNYDRLVEVKRRYDPDNLFRVNQNIAP